MLPRVHTQERSPTAGLFIGLIITLAAVVAYSVYVTFQISNLKTLQSDISDRNRRDSLQLLRIQNDLNSLGLAMNDMVDNDEPYPITAWRAQFDRTRGDLSNAFQLEAQLATTHRTPEQSRYLSNSLAQFWDATDRMFAMAEAGNAAAAREQVRITLQAREAALSNFVARLLVENNERDEQASRQVAQIYDGVQRQAYIFLIATLIAIALTSLYLIRSNRRLFARLASLSNQRSDLAQKLIATQESTLRYISRELHDEFGQILTAIGSMLVRAEKHAPENSPLRAELREVNEIAQVTLDNIRSLSQALHPVMLDEMGLESTVDWYIPTMAKQTGIDIHYEKSGSPFAVNGNSGIHIYRVLQEALNNVARHSGAKETWVRLRFEVNALELEVEDHGKGFVAAGSNSGIGLVAMRERAELLNGSLELSNPDEGGTLVRLRVPRPEKQETEKEEPERQGTHAA
jgi:signal transduction histidine kinase